MSSASAGSNINSPPPPIYTCEMVGNESANSPLNVPYAYHYPTSTQSHGYDGTAEVYQDENGHNGSYLHPSSSDDGSVSMNSVGDDARASTATPTPSQRQSPVTLPRSQIYNTRGSLSVADVSNITTASNNTHRPPRRLSIQVHRSGGSQSACSAPTPQPGRLASQGKHFSYPLPNIPNSSIPQSSASTCHEAPVDMYSQQRDNEPAATAVSDPAPFSPTRPSLSTRGAGSDTTAACTFVVNNVKLNAVNYASLYRKGAVPSRRFLSGGSRSSAAIRGTFTINPFLHIPSELLPALAPAAGLEGNDETSRGRKNLRLEMENGGIDVDIYLVGEFPFTVLPLPGRDGRGFVQIIDQVVKSDMSTKATTLHLEMSGTERVKSCSLNARIHNPFFSSEVRPPFHLTAINKSSNKSSSTLISLPRSFHGMLIITVHAGDPNGHIVLSRKLADRAVILSESNKARWYFVGEMGNWDRETDKVEVWVVGGKVMLQWEGEGDRDGKKGNLKWW